MLFCGPPLKLNFSVNPHNIKISQFKFLVIIEKNMFVYKLKCPKIFQILVYFLCKNCTLLKKITLSFPATSLSRLRYCHGPPPPPPLKIWSEAQPPAERGEEVVHTMFDHLNSSLPVIYI